MSQKIGILGIGSFELEVWILFSEQQLSLQLHAYPRPYILLWMVDSQPKTHPTFMANKLLLSQFYSLLKKREALQICKMKGCLILV